MISDKNVSSVPVKTQNPGINIGKGAIALMMIGGIMGMTNPPRQEYLSYASQQLAHEIKKSICNQSKVPDVLGNIADSLVSVCQTVVTSQRHNIERFIDNATKRDNFLILSVYTTEIDGRTYQSIGAFGNFLTFPPSQEKKARSSDNNL
jgi:hypothetical protein